MLRSDRLEISPLDDADVAAFLAYRRIPDVARYQSWSADYSQRDAHDLVSGQPASELPAPGEWLQLGLRAMMGDPPVRTLIGDVAVGSDQSQPSTFELGVTIAPACQGTGFASEALECVIDWLFRVHHAHRIVMQGDARNVLVLALMRRLGLRHEGTALEGDWFKGEWTTLERFALLRREWTARAV